MSDTLAATIPQEAMYSFDSQAKQFPKKGKPGLGYEQHDVATFPVECWLWRNHKGHVVGILYYYPKGGPQAMVTRHDGTQAWEELEKPGNVNVFVRPDRQRRGIGTRLVKAYEAKHGPIKWDQQRMTPAGVKFAYKLASA